MTTLLDDLELLERHAADGTGGVLRGSLAQTANRLRAFIEQHQPWHPPRQPGFGPWIEYDGKNGPRVDQIVRVLSGSNRAEKYVPTTDCPAWGFGWSGIVAYCVKEDQP